MVFNTEEEEVRNNNVARQQAIRQARFLKVSGDAVVRVVKRVDNAEENNNLGELLKFIYTEKATKFCKIFTLLLTGTTYLGQKLGGDFAQFCGILRG